MAHHREPPDADVTAAQIAALVPVDAAGGAFVVDLAAGGEGATRSAAATPCGPAVAAMPGGPPIASAAESATATVNTMTAAHNARRARPPAHIRFIINNSTLT